MNVPPWLGLRRRPPAAPLSARAVRDEWLEWLRLSGMSDATIYGYRRTTDRFLNRWPDIALADFTDEQIQGFIEEAKPASRQTRRAPFTNWFAWAFRTRRIALNPMHHVPNYKNTRPPHIEVFSDDECKILCALPEPHGTLMALLLGTGLRKGEARMLTVRRFDLEHAELHVVEGAKGKHPRVVPMSTELVARMAGYFLVEGLGPNDYLWPIRPGGGAVIKHDRPIHPASFHHWWGDCIEQAGIPYRKPHTSRHSYATEWRRRGLVMDDVAVLLGHCDLKTTKTVYDHTNVFDVKRRMDALEGKSGN